MGNTTGDCASSQDANAPNSGAVRSQFQPDGVTTMEGLLYPETYRIEDTEDEEAVLRRAGGEHADERPAGAVAGQVHASGAGPGRISAFVVHDGCITCANSEASRLTGVPSASRSRKRRSWGCRFPPSDSIR